MSLHTDTGHISTEELFRQHAGFVTRFLACCGVPAEHIEDAVQEVFLVVHRNGGYRPGIAKPTSYLGNISFYAASKYRSRERVASRWRSDDAVEYVASETASPMREAQVQQDVRRLRLALDRLPDDLRTTLLLVELEGESCLSVAGAFGCPVGTVYWRLHQARKKLQSALKSIDAERLQSQRDPASAAGLEKRPLPSLGVIVFFIVKSSFKKSEAGRLLRLTGEQLTPRRDLGEQLAKHQQLVKAGGELPTWAAKCLPHTTSLSGLIGVGLLESSLVVGSVAAVATAILMFKPTPSESNASSLQSETSPANSPSAEVIQPAAIAHTEKPALALSSNELGGEVLPIKRVTQVEPEITHSLRPRRNAARVVTTDPSRTNRPRLSSVRKSMNGSLRTDLLRSNAALESTSAQADEQSVATDPLAANEAVEPSMPMPAPEEQSAAEETSSQVNPSDDPPSSAEPQQIASKRPDDPFVVETRAITNAERLLATDPARALTIVRKLRTRFPQGYFGEERAYVEVIALLKLGRFREGRAKADKFLRAYPIGPYSQRVGNAAVNRDNNR